MNLPKGQWTCISCSNTRVRTHTIMRTQTHDLLHTYRTNKSENVSGIQTVQAFSEFSTIGFVFRISSLKVINPSNIKVLQSETRLQQETDETSLKHD